MSTYCIPEFERPVQIAIEAVAVLEPILALRLDLGPCLQRGRVVLQRQVIQVRADGDSQAAVVVVDERKPALGQQEPQGPPRP